MPLKGRPQGTDAGKVGYGRHCRTEPEKENETSGSARTGQGAIGKQQGLLTLCHEYWVGKWGAVPC